MKNKVTLEQQTTSSILMIRPARFTLNTQTVETCTFQKDDVNSQIPETHQAALKEFDNFVAILRNHGVNVIVIEDTPEPHTPDSIFPNNWVSFHENGTVVIYPMLAENRRPERRHDIIEQLATKFKISTISDITAQEEQGLFLEGTGSMVLDRRNGIAYACLSPRTHLKVLEEFAKKMMYSLVAFQAFNQNTIPVYHTNVVMSIGEQFQIVCLKAIPDRYHQSILTHARLARREIIELTMEQMNHFAGNVLQIKSKTGRRFIVMSKQAYTFLAQEQIEMLQNHGTILQIPLDTIETYGGGSARCMLAEIFLPEL